MQRSIVGQLQIWLVRTEGRGRALSYGRPPLQHMVPPASPVLATQPKGCLKHTVQTAAPCAACSAQSPTMWCTTPSATWVSAVTAVTNCWLQPPHIVAAPWPAPKLPRFREAAAMHLQCSRSVADLELPGALASWSGVCSHNDQKRTLLAVIHKDPKAVHAAAGSALT